MGTNAGQAHVYRSRRNDTTELAIAKRLPRRLADLYRMLCEPFVASGRFERNRLHGRRVNAEGYWCWWRGRRGFVGVGVMLHEYGPVGIIHKPHSWRMRKWYFITLDGDNRPQVWVLCQTIRGRRWKPERTVISQLRSLYLG